MRGAADFVNKNFNYPVTIAEVGVEKGLNSAEMVQKMNVKTLYAIDEYAQYTDYLGGLCPLEIQDEVYRTMFINLTPHWDKIVLVTRSSINASKLFPDEFFDFVYIDGNHNYECVTQDMNLWLPKVKKGCVLGGHDFDTRNVTRQDVTEAVKDFTREYGLEYIIFPEPGLGGRPAMSDWVIIR